MGLTQGRSTNQLFDEFDAWVGATGNSIARSPSSPPSSREDDRSPTLCDMQLLLLFVAGTMLSSILAFQRPTAPLPSLPRLAVRTLLSMTASAEDATKVLCAERSSVGVAVEEGKTYSWCTCGRSSKQPFCDGSHAGTDFRSMVPQLKIWI